MSVIFVGTLLPPASISLRRASFRTGLVLLTVAALLLAASVRRASADPQASGQSSPDPLTFWSRMNANEKLAAGEGVTFGALAGAFISAYPAMSEGAGGNLGGESLGFVAAGAVVGGLVGGALGYLAEQRWPSSAETETCHGYSLLNPCAGQFDLQIGSPFGFTGPGSLVRVRENRIEGTGLSFGSDMGINTQQMPTLDLRYWFTRLDAFHFRFRYFNMGGTRFSATPIAYNGAIIPGGRTNNFDPWEWFEFGFYYEHRLAFYRAYEQNWPLFLKHWDLRTRMGIEYTYLYYEINGGHTPTKVSPIRGQETAEDFYHQSMPLPTIGMEAYRRINRNFIFQASFEGNWINRWNSLRSEGGTVWASQNGFEGHARLIYENPQYFGAMRLMAGMFVYYYSQLEDSHEDGNFIRWSSFGPEVDIGYSF